jgi:hypothetical protein
VGITGYSAWSLARAVEERALRPDRHAGLPEYRPAGLKANHRPGQLQEVEQACRAAARICATLDRGSSRQAWRIATDLDADIALPVTDFPQWRLTVDGSAVERRVDPQDGLIRVRLEPGDHRVELEWVPSALERAGSALSGMSLLLWGALLLGGRRIRRVGNLVASAF